MEFSVVTFLLIMVAMAFADVCWTLYFIDVEERKAHPAAFWSAMIILKRKQNLYCCRFYRCLHRYLWNPQVEITQRKTSCAIRIIPN